MGWGGNTQECMRGPLLGQGLRTAHPCRNGRAQTCYDPVRTSDVRTGGREGLVLDLVDLGAPGEWEQRQAEPGWLSQLSIECVHYGVSRLNVHQVQDPQKHSDLQGVEYLPCPTRQGHE